VKTLYEQICERHADLPWDELGRTDAIPWDAIAVFANALPQALDLGYGLELHYETPRRRADWGEATCGDIYAVAIFVAAVPECDPHQQDHVARFLVRELVRSEQFDEDYTCEFLAAACRELGTLCVPPVLSLYKAFNPADVTGYLSDLLVIGAKSEDPELRESVVQTCLDVLRPEQGVYVDGYLAAETGRALIAAGYPDAETRSLMESHRSRPNAFPWDDVEIQEVLDLLDGKEPPYPDDMNRPFRTELKTYWRRCRDWQEERRQAGREEAERERFEIARERSAEQAQVGRNDPCPCGSGKKYKKCCGR
jgi:hypothetical protein